MTRAARSAPWLARVAQRWHATHTILPEDRAPLGRVLARKAVKGTRVSVVLPALNEAETIGEICTRIRRDLIETAGLVDELVVVDSGSTDGTAARALEAGARVISAAEMLPSVPFVGGKGDAMWRSLTDVDGDIVAFIDADIRNFSSAFVTSLVSPLLVDDDVAFVKGFYRRPIAHGDDLLPSGGGRVTELLARPLLSLLFPELGGFVQPLSGEYAGRREVLEQLPFFTGYGVEVGILIDLLDVVGLDRVRQADLDVRVHRNRPIEQLGAMAFAIAQTIMQRAEEQHRIKVSMDYPSHPLLQPAGAELLAATTRQLERPPLQLVPGRATEALIAP